MKLLNLVVTIANIAFIKSKDIVNVGYIVSVQMRGKMNEESPLFGALDGGLLLELHIVLSIKKRHIHAFTGKSRRIA